MKNNIFRLLIIAIFACTMIFISCGDKENQQPNKKGMLENSMYEGSGTPLAVSNPAPKNWEGDLVFNNDLDDIYYTVYNWANKIIIYLYEDDGEIFLDLKTVITIDDDNLNWCLGVGYFEDGKLNLQRTNYKYKVDYDSADKILDFSGRLSGNKAVVGIVRRDNSGNVHSFYGDTFYADAILELTPSNGKSGTLKSAAIQMTNENIKKPSKKIETYENEIISMDKVRYLNYIK